MALACKPLWIACCLARLDPTPLFSIRNRSVFLNSCFSSLKTYSLYSLPKARILCTTVLPQDSNTACSLLKTSIPLGRLRAPAVSQKLLSDVHRVVCTLCRRQPLFQLLLRFPTGTMGLSFSYYYCYQY